jgi:hypothetical protein
MAKAKRRKSASINLRLDPALKAKAEKLATATQRSISKLIEFLIRQEAEKISSSAKTRKPRRKRSAD